MKRKKVEESSDEDGDQKEPTDGKKEKKKRKKKVPNKKHFERRNIRDVFNEDMLEASTKNALAEEQQRLQRLQQAQRDAYANEVLKEFDFDQFSEIKDEDIAAEFDQHEPSTKIENDFKQSESDLIDQQVKNEPSVKNETIDLSSDEDVKPKVTFDLTTKKPSISINGLSITIPAGKYFVKSNILQILMLTSRKFVLFSSHNSEIGSCRSRKT